MKHFLIVPEFVIRPRSIIRVPDDETADVLDRYLKARDLRLIQSSSSLPLLMKRFGLKLSECQVITNDHPYEPTQD